MAKKKRAAKNGKPSRGKKLCPKCGAEVGIRTRQCPKCQYQFPIKGKKQIRTAAKKKTDKAGDVVSALFAATDFAGQVGGVDQAISLLEAVKIIRR